MFAAVAKRSPEPTGFSSRPSIQVAAATPSPERVLAVKLCWPGRSSCRRQARQNASSTQAHGREYGPAAAAHDRLFNKKNHDDPRLVYHVTARSRTRPAGRRQVELVARRRPAGASLTRSQGLLAESSLSDRHLLVGLARSRRANYRSNHQPSLSSDP